MQNWDKSWFSLLFMIPRAWILWFNYQVTSSTLNSIVIKYLYWRGCIWHSSNEWDSKRDENEAVFHSGNNTEDLITHNHATLDFIRHLQIFNKKNHSTSRHIAFIPCTCNNDILNIPFRFDLYSIHFLIHILTNINSTYTQGTSSHILNQCVTCKYKNKNRHKSYDHVFDWLEMKMASLSHRDP